MSVDAAESVQSTEDWRRGEPRTVAFVDILGFGEELEKSRAESRTLPRMVDALLGGLADPKSSADEGPGIMEPFKLDRQQTFFSDCAVVSARCVPGAPDEVVEVVLRYARHLLQNELVLRGGITRGVVVHRGNLVVGPAVLTAYLMERDAAYYPRIILEDEIAEELLAIEDSPNKIATVRRSEDGLYFLDVLTTLGLRTGGPQVLFKARKLIWQRLKDRRSLAVHAKWRWMAAQYNRALICIKAQQTERTGTLPAAIRAPEVAVLP